MLNTELEATGIRKIEVISEMLNNLSKNQRLILTLPLLLAIGLFLPSGTVPSARAQFTGLVCIVFPSTSTTCPTSSPTYGPVTAGTNITVGVFVQGSDAMGGWDIYVKSDNSILNPVSAALGTLVASPSLTSICINGSAQTGSCTVGTANGAGVVEATTIESTGTNECGGISPCSGLALTITYHVVSSAASTTLTYPSAAGCGNTSIAGTTDCVLIADAVGTTLPESIQTPAATITQATFQGVCLTYPATMLNCNSPMPFGPFSAGQTFTVGVFAQNSLPIGGFDIYAKVDTHYLKPVNASLGTLITTPSLTNICVAGTAIVGACTPNPNLNGPNVVEVSTIESSGTNDAGTGLLFSITYNIVHANPSTQISYPTDASCSNTSVPSPPNLPDTCVLVANATGTTLPENIQSAFVNIPHLIDPTTINVSCFPSSVPVGQDAVCTATVNDTAKIDRTFPIGIVVFTTSANGVFQPTNRCELQQIGSTATSNCFTSYLGLGSSAICGGLGGIYDPVFGPLKDPTHSGNTTSSAQCVSKATPTLSTVVIIDQTGLPAPGGFVRLGQSVHDDAIMNGGYPATGVTGNVSYSVFTNGLCSGTATVISNVRIQPANNVPNSGSFLPAAAGSYSFNATYTGDGNNFPLSTCEPFTVTAYPGFTAGKLHWTHHLSLSKSGNTQSWTAIVIDPLSVGVQVVVRIVGSSAVNPTLTFDVTCGLVCVTTPRAGVNAINATQVGLISVGAGATVSFSFSQSISNAFMNNKISFTATVYWTSNGTDFTQGTSKSGSFAVVP